LLYDNRAGGIALFKQNGAVSSSNIRILNNTVVMSPDGWWALKLADAACASNKVFNNILWCNHPARGSICLAVPRPDGFASDYNIVSRRFSVNGGANPIDPFAWRPLGYDPHSIVTTLDKIFVDVAKHDYHLKPGSLAIGAGMKTDDVPDDLASRPRPRHGRLHAGWDIGAYGYGK
jgi:hypothetical protein